MVRPKKINKKKETKLPCERVGKNKSAYQRKEIKYDPQSLSQNREEIGGGISRAGRKGEKGLEGK